MVHETSPHQLTQVTEEGTELAAAGLTTVSETRLPKTKLVILFLTLSPPPSSFPLLPQLLNVMKLNPQRR